mgnify:CR=1 FL=1
MNRIAKLTAALPKDDNKPGAPPTAPEPRGLRIAFVGAPPRPTARPTRPPVRRKP